MGKRHVNQNYSPWQRIHPFPEPYKGFSSNNQSPWTLSLVWLQSFSAAYFFLIFTTALLLNKVSLIVCNLCVPLFQSLRKKRRTCQHLARSLTTYGQTALSGQVIMANCKPCSQNIILIRQWEWTSLLLFCTAHNPSLIMRRRTDMSKWNIFFKISEQGLLKLS